MKGWTWVSAAALAMALAGCGGDDDDDAVPDAASVDASGGTPDSSPVDAPPGTPDAPPGTPDAPPGTPDGSPVDAASADGSPPDAGSPDGSPPDAAAPDAAPPDAAPPDATPIPDGAPIIDSGLIICGDWICQAAENCSSCEIDCGECPGPGDDGGTGLCPHDECTIGLPMNVACGECVASICLVDSFCCDSSWDSICVGEVVSVCGKTCP